MTEDDDRRSEPDDGEILPSGAESGDVEEWELDEFGRDPRGRIPADRAEPGDHPEDIIPAAPRYRADGERMTDPDLAAVGRVADASESEVLAATADLDDDTPADLPPTTAPLTLDVVEDILNRRRPETQINPSLDRITALVDLLGQPQRAFPVIQVGGTNGKTSTARMIDALLARVGVRTGRFTSPHLQSVLERFSIDGEPIDAELYVSTYADVAPYADLADGASARAGGIALSKFEILTALAFALFADVPVEVAVIEVGLGGRWDSTNVADAVVAAIGPIGLDHTDYLGDTIAEIAGVKAGIIKPGATVVLGAQSPEAMEVLLERAVEVDATVARLGSEFAVQARDFAVGGQRLTLRGLGGVYEEIFLPLPGAHQADNAAVALAAVEAFFGAGPGRPLDAEAVQDAFASVASPGRLERIGLNPTVLIDAAHNPDGAAALAAALASEFSFQKLVAVVAVMADKDVAGVLGPLAQVCDEVVVTVNSSPRSLPLDELRSVAERIFGEDRVHSAGDLPEALATARARAVADGADGAGVVVTGSVVTAGDARALAGLKPA